MAIACGTSGFRIARVCLSLHGGLEDNLGLTAAPRPAYEKTREPC